RRPWRRPCRTWPDRAGPRCGGGGGGGPWGAARARGGGARRGGRGGGGGGGGGGAGGGGGGGRGGGGGGGAGRGAARGGAGVRGRVVVGGVVVAVGGAGGAEALTLVRGALGGVWRASSLVEGINSVLRMQQARHRKVTAGLLDLKRLYWNCHRFRTGQRRGQ